MKDFEMIKRKLVATKNFVKDYAPTAALAVGATAFVALCIVAEAEALSEPQQEVVETDTHTIILIKK